MNNNAPGSSFIIHRSSLEFRLPRGRKFTVPRPPGVIGIINVTPDSFSDGGVHLDHSKAVHAALQMEQDGALVIDIGGESTRPDAEPIAAQVEIDRVIPVIEQIRQRSDVPISIDTRKGSVAEEALAAGADVINDVSALRYSAGMPGIAAKSGVPVILMHNRDSADPAIDIVPTGFGTRPSPPPSSLQSDLFRALEGAQAKVFPGTATLPVLLTGATDSAQLRAKGVQAYGLGRRRQRSRARGDPRERRTAVSRRTREIRPVHLRGGDRRRGDALSTVS